MRFFFNAVKQQSGIISISRGNLIKTRLAAPIAGNADNHGFAIITCEINYPRFIKLRFTERPLGPAGRAPRAARAPVVIYQAV